LKWGFYPGNRVTVSIRQIDAQRFALTIPELNKAEKPRYTLGLWVLISLSSELSITVNGPSTTLVLSAKQGDYKWITSDSQTKEGSVIIDFVPDKEVFKEFEIVYEQINAFLQQFAYLNPELKFISEDHAGKEFQRNVFHYPKGVFQQLDLYLSQKDVWYIPVFRFDIDAAFNHYHYNIAIYGPDSWIKKGYQKTFAGNIETHKGGSLEDGIVQGLLLGIKALAKKAQRKIHVNEREIKTCFTFIATVQGKEFSYEGSTRLKLGVPLIKKEVTAIVYERMMEYYLAQPDKINEVLRAFRIW
jgi:DNA gyrase/topoisomerase IV subunit B